MALIGWRSKSFMTSEFAKSFQPTRLATRRILPHLDPEEQRDYRLLRSVGHYTPEQALRSMKREDLLWLIEQAAPGQGLGLDTGASGGSVGAATPAPLPGGSI